MKSYKKSFPAVSVMLFGLAACVSCSGSSVSATAPDYSSYRDTNVMGISGWVAPCPENWNNTGNPDMITDEGYKQLKDCGFNSIYALYEFLSSSATAKAANLAGKYDIKYYARDTGNICGDPIEDGLSEGDIRDRAYVQAYCNEKGFAGHLATDEPSATDFVRLGHLKEFYETEFPGKEFYVNLFPTYALLSQIGTTSYEEYIDQYIDLVNPDFISYDHYALQEDAYGHMKTTGDVLYNHKIIAEKATAAGIPYGNFTQTIKFDNSSRNILKESEMRWQIMTDLAYGCSRVQYFCYVTPLEWEGTDYTALVDKEGNPTIRYYFAQNINKTIASMDEAYLNYLWKGTLLVEGSEEGGCKAFDMVKDESPTSVAGIRSVSANYNTLVGQFDSRVDDCKGYMITNFAEPSVDTNVDNVKVSFDKKYTKALIYNKETCEEVSLKKGVLEYSIDPGDGAFVIPF